eukprot:jgi/Chlat1/1149/Chrsp112S01611
MTCKGYPSSPLCLQDQRRVVGLEELRGELSRHLALLQRELVSLINQDYADFVSLSTMLVDVSAKAARMRPPLQDLRAKLVEVRAAAAAALAALQQGLEKRAEAAAARQTLELLLDAAHVASKVEKLLAEQDGGGGDNDNETIENGVQGSAGRMQHNKSEAARARLLERVASEMNRLRFLTTRGQGLPLVTALAPRVEAAEKALVTRLEACLRRGLATRDSKALFHVLQAFLAAEHARTAERVVREVLVAPLVADVFTAPEASGDVLRAELQSIAPRTQEQLGFLLELTHGSGALAHGFDWLAASVLAEVSQQLTLRRAAALGPGLPALFHAHYLAALDFLCALEAMCPTKAAVQAFRAHSAYSDFLAKWNLGVYFTLRYQDFAGALDAALDPSRLWEAAAAKSTLSLAASNVLNNALLRCWTPDTFLAALSHRFLKLSLQLLARYRTRLEEGVHAITGFSTAVGYAPQGQGSASAVPPTWASSASPEDFVLMYCDIQRLSQAVQSQLLPLVAGCLSHLPEAASKGAQSALQNAAESLAALSPAIMAVVMDALTEKCAEVVKQLRSITTLYRMTNKPMPTRPSHFVPLILQPLRAFSDGERAALLSPERRTELAHGVALKVTTRFDETARDFVTTVKKTESSLKRLKGRTGGMDGSASGGVSDTDKIMHQLVLDVKEYGKQLQRIGIDAAQLEPYRKLWECVSPAEDTALPLLT